MQRGIKAGTRVGSGASSTGGRKKIEHKELEVGIIQEPLPVYQKEPTEDDRRVAVTVGEAESHTASQPTAISYDASTDRQRLANT